MMDVLFIGCLLGAAGCVLTAAVLVVSEMIEDDRRIRRMKKTRNEKDDEE